MAVRLPPLSTLLAFEAAARLSSFTAAARELSLTHSAISHQVAALEARLNAKLFRREHNRMRPTTRGKELWFQVRYALELLERAFEQSSPAVAAAVELGVSVLPSFARLWLLPRLAAFALAHPLIDLCIHTTTDLAQLGGDGIDCAIRYGIGNWPGLQQELLANDALVVMASPRYRDGQLPRTPEELVSCTLLRNPLQPWETWLQAAGVQLPAGFRFGPGFSDSGMALDAAAAGLGIALGRRLLIAQDLAAGRLVQLFALAVPDDKHYYLVWRADSPKLPAILELRRWLLAQLTVV